MLINVTGLVIREISIGESDKILVLLTPEMGKLTVYANGVKKYKNPNMNSAQLMGYSEYTLYKHGEKYWVREAFSVENFYDIRLDLERFALALYILDVVNDVCVENESEETMLKLTLNTLYMLVKNNKGLNHIKGVFELSTAVNIGFMPDLLCCSECKAYESDYMYFNIMSASLKCEKCFLNFNENNENSDEGSSLVKQLPLPVVKAMRHIIYGSPSKIYAFKLSGELYFNFNGVCESYLLHHIERGFKTLDFYKEVKDQGR